MFLQILIWPLIALFIAQLAKFFISSNRLKFSWQGVFAYSGMPSGHSAMVSALAGTIALYYGFNSPFFAIAAILAIIVIRDATGLRRYLGQHGRTLNILVKDLKEDDMLDASYPTLLERIGHTPAQVFFGILIGLAVSLLGFWLFP